MCRFHNRPKTRWLLLAFAWLAISTSPVYNLAGQVTSRTDELGHSTSFEYDALGRLTAVVDALNQRTEYEPTRGTGGEVDNPQGWGEAPKPRAERLIQYDETGAQTVQRDALGRETTYQYDQLGRRVGRTLPDGQSESMSYDVIGNLKTRTDFNGHTTTYTYDLMNRLTQKQADPGHPSLVHNHAPKTITYGYDDLGRRTTAESQNSGGQVLYQDAWTYDVRGRTINHASSNAAAGSPANAVRAITYDYDDAGNLTLTQSDHPQGGATATYDYDDLNRLINVYDHNVDDGAGNVPAAAHYAYDGVGNLSAMTYSNGVRHSYTYNTLNRLTQLTVTDALSNVLHSYSHTLNAAGHKTQVVEADGRTVNYAFDQLHRLQSETIAASPGPMGVNGTASYAYDQVSNRISRTSSIAGVVNQSFAFNDNDQIDGSGYAYDDNGSTTQGPGGSQDVYSFDNMLIRRVNTGLTVDMVYSATGDRVQKVTNGVAVNYLVDTNNHTGYAQVLEESDAGGNLTAVMVYGHDLISQDRADGQGGFEMSFYSYDGLGSVRGLTDSIGTSLGQYHYDAYGTKIEDTVSVANPYLFAGERFDNDLGLYYLRARYLDVETGRFWSLDPYEGVNQDSLSLHKYLYAHGNPVTNVDPSGNMTLVEAATSVGVRTFLFNAFISEGITKLSGGDIYEVLLNALLGGTFGYLGSKVGAIALNSIKSASIFNGVAMAWEVIAGVVIRGLIGASAAGITNTIQQWVRIKRSRQEQFDYDELKFSIGLALFVSGFGGLVTEIFDDLLLDINSATSGNSWTALAAVIGLTARESRIVIREMFGIFEPIENEG